MVEEEKVGLVLQYVIACFQPARYKALLANKLSQIVRYIFVLCAFLAFVEYAIPFLAWTTSVGGIENLLTSRIPQFEVKDGTFTIASPIEISLGNTLYVETLGDVEEITTDNLKEDVMLQVVVGKSNMYIKQGRQIFNYAFDQFKDTVITNQTFIEQIPLMKLALALSFLFYIVRKVGSYLIYTLFFTFICTGGRAVKSIRELHFKEAFLVTLYASTLGGILNSVNQCAGFPVDSFYMALIAVSLMMFLIYRAARGLDKPAE